MFKKCKKCDKSLEIDINFYKDKRINGGYRNICKVCEGGIKIKPTHLTCSICLNTVEYDKFSIKTNRCDECYSILRREKKSNCSKLGENRERSYVIHGTKNCIDCGIEKNIDLFPIRKSSKDFHRNQCDECYSLKLSKTKKVYRQINKEELQRKFMEYHKNRMKTDPLYRAKIDARNIIRKAISEKGYSKKSKTEEILGCSYVDFKNYIESLFLHGMSWENRSLWHIDHIIPLAFAETERELLLINRYNNLRPLWIDDNQKKSDDIELKNEIYYQILEMRETSSQLIDII